MGLFVDLHGETDSVNFIKATRGAEANADTRSCFASAKLLKLTVNAGFVWGGVIFVANSGIMFFLSAF